MIYVIIIDDCNTYEFFNQSNFEQVLSWYRNPANGYLGRVKSFMKENAE